MNFSVRGATSSTSYYKLLLIIIYLNIVIIFYYLRLIIRYWRLEGLVGVVKFPKMHFLAPFHSKPVEILF